MKLYTLIFVLLSVGKSFCSNGVCIQNNRVTKLVTEPHQRTYVERYRTKCYKLFSCTKTRINTYMDTRAIQVTNYVKSEVCCQGYVASNSPTALESLICKPICVAGCVNANCTEPGVCTCFDGFTKENYLNICNPVCSGCINGQCRAPESCTCNFGYEKLNNTHCSPSCTGGCENGVCVAPDVCLNCNAGFLEVNGKCTPQCTGCEHGQCVSPENCTCFDGYKLENNTCLPFCENGCQNGTCVAPNQCKCQNGYQYENGTCIPICTECEHGECVAPQMCKCYEGYQNQGCKNDSKSTTQDYNELFTQFINNNGTETIDYPDAVTDGEIYDIDASQNTGQNTQNYVWIYCSVSVLVVLFVLLLYFVENKYKIIAHRRSISYEMKETVMQSEISDI